MQSIPLLAVPSQTLSVVLAAQNTQINLYSLQTPGDILNPANSSATTELQGYPALYADVLLAGVSIIACRIVRNGIRWLLDAGYQGYSGDFVMVDTQANTEPVYTGLGGQYQLVYLSTADLAT